ncbi:MAG: fibronectin type III domain-containing protein, partial [Acidobacteria bacterium]|nr:fibronectin type III domain-containing protein [Acidobacteriota bacterium]
PSSNEVVLDIAVTGACTQPPDPPSGLASQVSGRTVTLSWQLSTIGAIPAGLHLVAGTAPGSSNLGTIPLAATATGFSIAVPPGTYYVRVATVNSCGVSAFSNEVQLTVS